MALGSMKNFITRVVAIALCAAAAASAQAQNLELAPNAPDQYVVAKGDTLWDISGRFFRQPWRWPEIWNLNRDQIRNPHRIYPGDLVMLDRSGGQPRLRLGKLVGRGQSDGTGLPVDRRQPQVRVGTLEETAIPTIDASAIEHFLNRPLIVNDRNLATDPRIVATQDGRVYLSRGDLAYARGVPEGGAREWHIYRQAKPLLHPETRQPLGWEALFVGSAQLERSGDPATLRVQDGTEEIGVGDRLLPAEASSMQDYVPHPPENDVDARIVAVYRGVTQVGKNSVVAISAGAEDGLERGHVLAILQRGRTVVDRETRERLKLPDEAVGHLLVFRVFDKIAYGLVMEATQSISVGDILTNP